MKNRFLIWTLGLIAILAASSCAPAATDIPSAATETLASATGTTASASTLPSPEATVPLSTAKQPVEAQVVATSRGPELEATDPTTVSLAYGQLQLVEFFRFT